MQVTESDIIEHLLFYRGKMQRLLYALYFESYVWGEGGLDIIMLQTVKALPYTVTLVLQSCVSFHLQV